MANANIKTDAARLKNYFGEVLNPWNYRNNKAGHWSLEKILAWYEDATVRSAHRMMGDLRDKKVLEIGFGTGAHLIWLARQGASVIGVDITPERVNMAMELIEAEGMNRSISLICEDIMNSDFSKETFDIIYGHDILMYMGGDYLPFAKKTYNMLKDGGKIIVVEALDGHPAAHVYRNLFLPKEFKYFTKYFNITGLSVFEEDYRCLTSEFFYILAPFAFIWKNWITSKTMFDIFERSLASVDKSMLKILPALKRYCWRIVFEAQK